MYIKRYSNRFSKRASKLARTSVEITLACACSNVTAIDGFFKTALAYKDLDLILSIDFSGHVFFASASEKSYITAPTKER